jgi:GNAT superfamily N-acetyltransferase
MAVSIVRKKLRTLRRVFAESGMGGVARAVLHPFVRVNNYLLNRLDVESYELGRFPSAINLQFAMATPELVKRIAADWTDREVGPDRYVQVYFEYGFRNLLVFLDAESGVPIHFHFVILQEDCERARKVLPWKIYHYLEEPDCAFKEWSYTFEHYRRLGASQRAMDHTITFCRERGVKWMYSHRGTTNIASVRLGEKEGFETVAIVRQLQFFRQARDEGFFFVGKAS